MFPRAPVEVKSAMKATLPLVIAFLLGVGVCGTARAGEAEEGLKCIFNGKDLTDWDGNTKFWSAKDGELVGQTTKENPTKGNTFIIWKGGTPGDFELRLSFKIEGGNSGVQYRSKDCGNWVCAGYQYDIRHPLVDAKNTGQCTGKLYDERGPRGQMAFAGEKVVLEAGGKKNVVGKTAEPKAIEDVAKGKEKEWNEVVIIAQGNHLIHKLNGVVTADVTDEDEAKRALSGVLGLQIHAGNPMTVRFKDIRIKLLDAAKDAKPK